MKLDRKKVKNLRMALQAAHEELGDIPLSQLTVMLKVTEDELYNEHTDGKRVAKSLGISASAASRYLSVLGEWSWHKKPGAEFIEMKRDFEDRRKMLIFLTDKGRTFVHKVTKLAYG